MPSKPTGGRGRSPDEFYTPDETCQKLRAEAASEGFNSRWSNVARRLASEDYKSEAQDALAEAFRAILDGRRRWPRDKSWDEFFFLAIQSEGRNMRRKNARVVLYGDMSLVVDASTHRGPGDLEEVEDRLLMSAIRRWVSDVFGAGSAVTAFVDGRLAGKTKDEIKAEMSIDDRGYDTLYRAFLRRAKRRSGRE